MRIDWTKLKCQETRDMIGDDYIRCEKPAQMLVLHYRDQKAYPMCLPCGDHNVMNRGGVLIQINPTPQMQNYWDGLHRKKS